MLRKAAALAIAVLLVACGPAPSPTPTGTQPPSVAPSPTEATSPTAAASASPALALDHFPPEPSNGLPDDIAAAMQAILDGSFADIGAPGLAAAVIAADRGLWAGAAGTADGTDALDPGDQFAIGSVTKTVVGAAVLRLVESGDVGLDRPIADYFPGREIPTNGATVRQVLGMRSGIPESRGDLRAICADLAATFSIEDMSGALSGDPQFQPGTMFRYTNANYLLAGLLIEEVTGSSVASVLRAGVLAEPGLERLVYQDAEKPAGPVAAPFVKLPGGDPVPSPNEILALGAGYLPARCLASTAGPAGGMASDPLTLARWGYLLYGGTVLGDEALAAMLAFDDGYGLASHDHSFRFGELAVGHEGTVPGYVAQLLAFPEAGVSVAVLANSNGVAEDDLTAIAGRLREALKD